MAEQIISPGVFQNENVPVALEAAAAPIGAAIIGPTTKGPINIPTTVTTYTDYVTKFGAGIVSGGIEYSYFTGISAQNYFKQGGTNLLVIRVVSGSEQILGQQRTQQISYQVVMVVSLSPNNVFTLSNNFSWS
jgi:hypothetical protein